MNQSKTPVLLGFSAIRCANCVPDSGDTTAPAILTQPSTTGFHADGVVVKPLSDTSLCFKTCVIPRADNTSRLVEEYVRMFLRRYSSQRLPPKRTELSLSTGVVSFKKAIGPSPR